MDPAGTFATSFVKDQALVRTRWQWLSMAAFLIVLLATPMLVGPRLVAIGIGIFIPAVVVLGLQLNTGYSGQINLGQAAFMGVGAYTAGLLSTTPGVPFVLTIAAAGVAAALFGFVFGLSAARIKGFYLALTTIAAQSIFHFLVLSLPTSWLGGANGLTVPSPVLLGYRLSTDIHLYYLCLAVLVLMTWGAYGIARSRHGRAFVAVRDDDVAAGIMGINVARTKALSFLVGAFYAGVGGALWAYYMRYVAVDQFTLIHSVWFVAMLIVGGMGSITGALIGVVIIVLVREGIATLGPFVAETMPFIGGQITFASMNIFLGGMIAAFLIFEPRGLMHRWNILKRSYRLWPFPY